MKLIVVIFLYNITSILSIVALGIVLFIRIKIKKGFTTCDRIALAICTADLIFQIF